MHSVVSAATTLFLCCILCVLVFAVCDAAEDNNEHHHPSPADPHVNEAIMAALRAVGEELLGDEATAESEKKVVAALMKMLSEIKDIGASENLDRIHEALESSGGVESLEDMFLNLRSGEEERIAAFLNEFSKNVDLHKTLSEKDRLVITRRLSNAPMEEGDEERLVELANYHFRHVDKTNHRLRFEQLFSELFASLDIPSMIMSALEEAEKEEKSAPGAKEFEKAMAARADKKFDLARSLLEKSFEAGYGPAGHRLGLMFEYGDGVTLNLTTSATYFQKCADMGNPECQYELGFLLNNGLGLPRNPQLGILNYIFAAEGNNPSAGLALGYRHMYGYGVEANCSQSASYFRMVAAQAAAEYRSSSSIPLDLIDLSNLEAVSEKSHEGDLMDLYEYSAEKGDVKAQLYLGYANLLGWNGLQQNPERAIQLFNQAAAMGEPAAHAALGQVYANGIGVPADNNTALHHFKKGSENGNPNAHNGMGFMYLNGYGVPKDAKKALEYFEKAAAQGNPEAQFNVGLMHFEGKGTPINYEKAFSYFGKAAMAGQETAQFQMGEMYFLGIGVKQNCEEAKRLFMKTAQKGTWGKIVDTAFESFQNKKYDIALLDYMHGAEQGYEVAQLNVGYMLERDLGTSIIVGNSSLNQEGRERRRYDVALSYFVRAARNGNIKANLKVGDFLFYGLGHRSPSPVEAVEFYKRASDFRDPQAMYNMGYMHQFGVGLPKDLHLAKRFYDQAIVNSRHTTVPVHAALWGLWFHSLLLHSIGGTVPVLWLVWETIWSSWSNLIIFSSATVFFVLLLVKIVRRILFGSEEDPQAKSTTSSVGGGFRLLVQNPGDEATQQSDSSPVVGTLEGEEVANPAASSGLRRRISATDHGDENAQ